MELVNEIYRLEDELRGDEAGARVLSFATATVASLLFPFAPHLGAEVYERVDRQARVGGAVAARPTERFLERDTVTVVVQVNGKVRDSIEVDARHRARTRSSARRSSARTCSATSTASRSCARSSCPGGW